MEEKHTNDRRVAVNDRAIRRTGAASKNNAVSAVIIVAVIAFIALLGSLLVLNLYIAKNRATEESIRVQQSENAHLAALLPVDTPTDPLETNIYALYTDETVLMGGDVISEYAILIDVLNNTVVAHKNGEARMYPASMTKVMTMIVAVEHIEDFNKQFTFTYHITDPAYKAGASIAGFLSSETVPLIDILYGIALPSGADCTTAIAVEVAGSEEAFVELMNEKAAELGLVNTHFENASGLHHPNHYTTPHEMAIILEYAMSKPLLAEVMATANYTTTSTSQHPSGLPLVSTLFGKLYSQPTNAEIIAGKTGYTPEARRCLASVAETPDGRRYVLVTGNAQSAESDRAAILDAVNIYENYIPK